MVISQIEPTYTATRFSGSSQTATASKLTSNHIGFLDGFRGFAALYVLVTHCMMWGGWYGLPLPDSKVAVDVFMIMSGYLMVHTWDSKSSVSPVTLRACGEFWVKRLFRIAPLYYLVLTLVFLCSARYCDGLGMLAAVTPAPWIHNVFHSPAMQTRFTASNFAMHISFLFGLVPKYSSSTFLPDWSIGLEMQFYAAFPLILLAFRKVGYFWISVTTLALCTLAQHFLYGPGFTEPSLLILKLHMFLIGMLLAEASRIHWVSKTEGFAVFLIAVIIAATSTRTSRPILVLTACVVFLLVSCGASQILKAPVACLNAFLANKATKFMADVSYGVYLTHYLFMSLIGGNFLYRQNAFLHLHPAVRVAILCVITIVGSYSFAYILHRLWERPAINAGRAVIKGLRLRLQSDRQRVPALL